MCVFVGVCVGVCRCGVGVDVRVCRHGCVCLGVCVGVFVCKNVCRFCPEFKMKRVNVSFFN